jgi:hypothetical protein
MKTLHKLVEITKKPINNKAKKIENKYSFVASSLNLIIEQNYNPFQQNKTLNYTL